MADRLQRLHALAAQKKESADPNAPSASTSTRRRIVARVLHVHDKQAADEDARLRREMKEMALRKREAELAQMSTETVSKAMEEHVQNTAAIERIEQEQETEEEEETSEEEEAPRLLMKPVFVPKEARQTVKEDEVEDFEEAEARRKQEAHMLLAEFVQLEGLTAAKRKEDELEATSGAFDPRSIDDTDGIDEEAELQAWRLRELLRMKVEKDEREARELEQIELERLRNLTEAEKQELDRQKQAEWEAKPKGEYKFLQKYYHKGAFFGDATDDRLLNRDYSAPTAADAGNKEMLPETMQVKDFGKRGRTKWTHLTAEDTTAFVDGWGDKKNPANYRSVGKMAGMKGDLSRPSKKHKRVE